MVFIEELDSKHPFKFAAKRGVTERKVETHAKL